MILKKTLSYKNVCITGASSGLGKALCRKFAEQHVSLLITGRDEKKLEELRLELNSIVDVIVHPADLSDKEQRKTLIERLKLFAPDLVINNAGYGIYGDALSTPTEEQLHLLAVNAEAVLEISLEAARIMIDNGIRGTILNISSSAAYFAFPAANVYAASKAFVNQFSQAFDIELEPFGIRVLTACPGQIATFFSTKAAKGHPQKPNPHAMTIDQAVENIFFQLEKQKRLYVFGWRYRMGVLLSRMLPTRWLGKRLRKIIYSRLLLDI